MASARPWLMKNWAASAPQPIANADSRIDGKVQSAAPAPPAAATAPGTALAPALAPTEALALTAAFALAVAQAARTSFNMRFPLASPKPRMIPEAFRATLDAGRPRLIAFRSASRAAFPSPLPERRRPNDTSTDVPGAGRRPVAPARAGPRAPRGGRQTTGSQGARARLHQRRPRSRPSFRRRDGRQLRS